MILKSENLNVYFGILPTPYRATHAFYPLKYVNEDNLEEQERKKTQRVNTGRTRARERVGQGDGLFIKAILKGGSDLSLLV